MIPADALVLLDTSVLLPILRGGPVAEHLLQHFSLLQRPERPLVCSVSIGELLRMGVRNGWGEAKLRKLAGLRQQLVVIDIGREVIYRAYADLGAHAQAAGRKLSDNDLWIAATASVTGAVLLTTDKDFDIFVPSHIEREWIDPKRLNRVGKKQ